MSTETTTHSETVSPSDTELVQQCVAGERSAFDALVERHFGLVYVIALGRLGNEEVARDLTQEVFLRAYLHIAKLREPARFPAWIARMAHNLAIEWLRRRRTASRLVPLIYLEGDAMNTIRDNGPGPEVAVEQEEKTRIIRDAIMKLPAIEREMILLHYVENLPQTEIAERVGLHPSTVTRTLERARTRMKPGLAADLGLAARTLQAPPMASSQALSCIAVAAALTPALRASVTAAAAKTMPALVLPFTSSSVAVSMYASLSGLLQNLNAVLEIIGLGFWKPLMAALLALAMLIGGGVAVKRAAQKPGSHWEQVSSILPHSAHASVVYDDKLWIIGGVAESGLKNDVWSSTDGTSWTQATAAAPFSSRFGHASPVFDGRLWLIGGYDGKFKNDIWSSLDGKNWSLITPSAAFPARFGHTSLVFQDRLFVIAGGNGNFKKDVWSSIDGKTWNPITPSAAFPARFGHTSLVFDNKLWVIGGYDGAFKNDIWNSTDGMNWNLVSAATPFSPRYGHTSVVFDDKLWVIGGMGENRTNDVWNSVDGKTWRLVKASAPFPTRYGHSSVVFENALWVIGGDHDDSGANRFRNDVWRSK